ncbi:hypothetical protein LMIY3S_03701 [Labrys miyagiensis]
MPKPSEICEITINGKVFRDWESVTATSAMGEPFRYVTVSVTEAVGSNGAVGQALQIKPGDMAEVKLAGQLFCKGQVYERQVAYDANNHAVRITVASQATPLSESSVPLKNGNFQNYSFQAIASSVLKPFGITLTAKDTPDHYSKPFGNVSTTPGESVWTFLERLARFRGVFLVDDENGNLVARGKPSSQAQAGLVEGGNILSANCLIQIPPLSDLGYGGQQKGSDTVSGEQARSPAAKTKMSGTTGYNYGYAHGEEPGDAKDMQIRGDTEQMWRDVQTLTAQVVIQGWLTADGKLFAITDNINVNSPMLILNQDLLIQETVFTQDSAGTRTTLTLSKKMIPQLGYGSSGGGSSGSPEPPASDASKATQPDIQPGTPAIDSPTGTGYI